MSRAQKPDDRPPPKIGSCLACGQELLLTDADCWHPWYVPQACPPEVSVDGISKIQWGVGFGRPGRDQWSDEISKIVERRSPA